MGTADLDGAALGNGVIGRQAVHEGCLDASVQEIFHGQGAGVIVAQLEAVALFLLLGADGLGLGGASLHAQLQALGGEDLLRGELGVLGHQEDAGHLPVGLGEVHLLAALVGDAHAGADHVDLLGNKGRNNAVPCHGLVLDLEAHLFGDPVEAVNVEAGGLAGLFVNIGERRIVGINAVDIGFLGKGRCRTEDQAQKGKCQNTFHYNPH